MRQAVYQIYVDALKPKLAAMVEQLFRIFKRLHAADGLLHQRIEILYAEAQTIEPHAAKRAAMLCGSNARIDFDAYLGVV